MSFQEQESYLDRLNSGTLNEDYCLESLSDSVDFGFFWAGPKADTSPMLRRTQLPVRFYLIKHDNKYCSIVYDVDASDLQVFTKVECRKNNITFKALDEVILPHLKLNRTHQIVSTKIGNSEARNLLKKLGFRESHQEGDTLFYTFDFAGS